MYIKPSMLQPINVIIISTLHTYIWTTAIYVRMYVPKTFIVYKYRCIHITVCTITCVRVCTVCTVKVKVCKKE